MPDHISRITGVTAVTLTRKAMNPEAKVFLLKSKAGRPGTTPTPKESVMDIKLLKSVAGFDSETQAYVGTLADDKVVEFVNLAPAARAELVSKSQATDAALLKGMVMMSQDNKAHVAHLPDDKVMEFLKMKPEEQAAAVKKSKDAAAAEAERQRAGDPEVVALRKSIGAMEQELAEGRVEKKKSRIRELAKSYPNVPSAYDQLTAIDGLSDEAKAPILAGLKSQETMAVNMTKSFTAERPSIEEGTAAAELDAVVEEVAKTKKLEKSAAFVQVSEDPKHAELISRVREEEGIAA